MGCRSSSGRDLVADCLVPFCRDECPILPDDAIVVRSSWNIVCEVCSKRIVDHPKFSYPTGMKHVYKICDGEYIHT